MLEKDVSKTPQLLQDYQNWSQPAKLPICYPKTFKLKKLLCKKLESFKKNQIKLACCARSTKLQ